VTRTSAYGTGSLLKARCPDCHRLISGGRVVDRRGYVIRLRKHKRDGQDCPGSGREAEMGDEQ